MMVFEFLLMDLLDLLGIVMLNVWYGIVDFIYLFYVMGEFVSECWFLDMLSVEIEVIVCY